jgi:hypothetical protein
VVDVAEFNEVYADVRSMHFTTCKPFSGEPCVMQSRTGRDWLAMKSVVDKTDFVQCKSQKAFWF